MTTKEHVDKFTDTIEDDQEDVVMKLSALSFQEDARKWFVLQILCRGIYHQGSGKKLIGNIGENVSKNKLRHEEL